jgi:hypothetical protein
VIPKKTESIAFKAPSGDIKASLMSNGKPSAGFAVVLPGAGYSCKQPLLYYAIQVLLKKDFDVLAIEKVYGEDPNWTKLPTMESALKVVENDGLVLFDEIQKRFGIHTVLGRSLGTYAMACALEKKVLTPAQIVWQTPSLNEKWNVLKNCGVRSFAIIGTADERFSKAKPYLPQESLIVDGADHGMEIADDPVRSIEILGQVTRATAEWIRN